MATQHPAGEAELIVSSGHTVVAVSQAENAYVSTQCNRVLSTAGRFVCQSSLKNTSLPVMRTVDGWVLSLSTSWNRSSIVAGRELNPPPPPGPAQ